MKERFVGGNVGEKRMGNVGANSVPAVGDVASMSGVVGNSVGRAMARVTVGTYVCVAVGVSAGSDVAVAGGCGVTLGVWVSSGGEVGISVGIGMVDGVAVGSGMPVGDGVEVGRERLTSTGP